MGFKNVLLLMGYMTSSNIDVKSQTKENGMLEKALHFLKGKKKVSI